MKRAIKASNFEESVELHINGEYACTLESDDYGDYYKIPKSADLILSVGDEISVVRVDHEMD